MKENFFLLHKKLGHTVEYLEDLAFKILFEEIQKVLLSAFLFNSQFEKYFANGNLDMSSLKAFKFFRNYVEGAYDINFEETFIISKLRVQAYLHLFPARKDIQ